MSKYFIVFLLSACGAYVSSMQSLADHEETKKSVKNTVVVESDVQFWKEGFENQCDIELHPEIKTINEQKEKACKMTIDSKKEFKKQIQEKKQKIKEEIEELQEQHADKVKEYENPRCTYSFSSFPTTRMSMFDDTMTPEILEQIITIKKDKLTEIEESEEYEIKEHEEYANEWLNEQIEKLEKKKTEILNSLNKN